MNKFLKSPRTRKIVGTGAGHSFHFTIKRFRATSNSGQLRNTEAENLKHSGRFSFN